MRTYLVTGGAGFIGSTLVKSLIQRGDRVVNLDKLTYAGNLDSLSARWRRIPHHFVRGDIADGKLVRQVLAEYQPQAIFHLAAESHVDRSIDAPHAFLQTNVVGTVQLLDAAREYWQSLSPERRAGFRFLHVSTDEVYGSLGPTGHFSEQTAYAPNSPYSASKAASDHFVRAFHVTYGLPTLRTNCSNNYGPYQFPEKLIPRMILQALQDEPLPVYGDGGNVRDWLHVDDHCAALCCVLERGVAGGHYNIGGGAEYTNLQVVHTICDLLDELHPRADGNSHRRRIQFVTDRPGHDWRYAIDDRKLRGELGWSPAHNFVEGLRDTVAWYLSNQPWIQRVISGRLSADG